jgi:hypothetical protein
MLRPPRVGMSTVSSCYNMPDTSDFYMLFYLVRSILVLNCSMLQIYFYIWCRNVLQKSCQMVNSLQKNNVCLQGESYETQRYWMSNMPSFQFKTWQYTYYPVDLKGLLTLQCLMSSIPVTQCVDQNAKYEIDKSHLMASLLQLSLKFWYPKHHTGHLILAPKC